MFGKKDKQDRYTVQEKGGEEKRVKGFGNCEGNGPFASTKGGNVWLPDGSEGDKHADTEIKKGWF